MATSETSSHISTASWEILFKGLNQKSNFLQHTSMLFVKGDDTQLNQDNKYQRAGFELSSEWNMHKVAYVFTQTIHISSVFSPTTAAVMRLCYDITGFATLGVHPRHWSEPLFHSTFSALTLYTLIFNPQLYAFVVVSRYMLQSGHDLISSLKNLNKTTNESVLFHSLVYTMQLVLGCMHLRIASFPEKSLELKMFAALFHACLNAFQGLHDYNKKNYGACGVKAFLVVQNLASFANTTLVASRTISSGPKQDPVSPEVTPSVPKEIRSEITSQVVKVTTEASPVNSGGPAPTNSIGYYSTPSPVGLPPSSSENLAPALTQGLLVQESGISVSAERTLSSGLTPEAPSVPQSPVSEIVFEGDDMLKTVEGFFKRA